MTTTTTPELGNPTDPALFTLGAELRRHHSRLELLVTTADPRTMPQGVQDALHDALANLADARHLTEALAWGWGQ